MDMRARPFRSVLYIPASRGRALDKARKLAVDAIIFDLEDAVSPEEKDRARDTLAEALSEGGYGHRMRIVRINALDTDWGRKDAAAVADMACGAVLLPKVDSPADLDALAAITGDVDLWAMIETPRGVLNAAAIAGHPRLCGMVMGTNDLARELGSRADPQRSAMMHALGQCLLAARAEGRVIIDGVYNAFKDDAGLRAEALQGRDLGFDGKSLIHPAQIEVVNEVFAPDAQELDLARRHIAAFNAARADGQGVAVVDGRIVENLHIATAQELLAKAQAIERIAAE